MLDEKDKIIIEYLMHDCRITNTKLAKILKISRPAVVYRIQKLEKEEYILRYDYLPDFNKFKIGMGVIFVSVPASLEKVFLKRMNEDLNVMSLFRLVHKRNYCITTFGSDDDVKGVLNYLDKNKLEYEYYKGLETREPAYSLFGININYKPPVYTDEIINLDENDVKLLEVLSCGGGRDSILELSQKTGLSYDLVLYRFKKLRKAGYLPLSLAQPNFEKFHLRINFLIIKTKDLTKEEFLKQMNRIGKTVVFIDFGDGVYLNTVTVLDLKDFNDTLEKYYEYLDGHIENIDIYPNKSWVFLNRIDLKKVLD